MEGIELKDRKTDKEYCQLAEGQYKYGKIIENEYLRVKLDFENSKVKTKELMQNYSLAVEYLKYIMNTDAGTKIVLTDSLKTLISGSQSNIESGFDFENRTEVKVSSNT